MKKMNLFDLKKIVDDLIQDGHGNKEVMVTEPNSDISLWSITKVDIDTVFTMNEQNKLSDQEVVLLYCGSGN